MEGEEGCRGLAYAPGKRRLTAPFPLQLWAQPGLRTPRARGWCRVASRTRHRPLPTVGFPSRPGAPDAAHPAHSLPAGGAVPTLDGRSQSEAAVGEGTRRPLLPPERGSGSDARDRWGQSWCRWGGEKLPLPPLPGAAEVKAEAGLAGAGGGPGGAGHGLPAEAVPGRDFIPLTRGTPPLLRFHGDGYPAPLLCFHGDPDPAPLRPARSPQPALGFFCVVLD